MGFIKSRSVYFKAAGIIITGVLVLLYPKETAVSAVNSINVCLSTIIPSMFAFMVISTYIQSSGLYRLIFRPVMWLMRRIVKADDSVISVFLLSLFGGYPIGVKLLKEMIAQNNNYHEIRQTCTNAASFCYCISPTFAIIMLGSGVFGSTTAGTVIYISNIIACIITAAVVSRIHHLGTAETKSKITHTGITDAVNSASHALFTVCTVILAFNTLLACVNAVFAQLGYEIPQIVRGILEISNLTGISEPDITLIPFVSAISSMGGLCVLLQCASIVNGAFPLGKFMFSRLICSALSAIISWLMLQFTDVSVSASTYSSEYIYEFSANKVIVLILVAMCIIIFNRSDKIFRKV